MIFAIFLEHLFKPNRFTRFSCTEKCMQFWFSWNDGAQQEHQTKKTAEKDSALNKNHISAAKQNGTQDENNLRRKLNVFTILMTRIFTFSPNHRRYKQREVLHRIWCIRMRWNIDVYVAYAPRYSPDIMTDGTTTSSANVHSTTECNIFICCTVCAGDEGNVCLAKKWSRKIHYILRFK